MRCRNYCFTYFLTDNDTDHANFVTGHDKLRAAIWQLESCPETGRRHYQGYIEYTSSIRLSAAKRHLGETVHFEPRKGTRQQAIEYCGKDDTRVEGPWKRGNFGDVVQGKRTDLHEVAELIQDGKCLSSVVEEHPVAFIKYRRGIEALYERTTRAMSMAWRTVTVLVYHGESGTGKTRKAIADAESDFYILDQGDRLWFDGYEGQDLLIIDDFYGWIKWGTLLRILDGHPFRCEVKGSFTWARWTKVIITSNAAPDEWYPSITQPRKRAALTRRITEITEFTE